MAVIEQTLSEFCALSARPIRKTLERTGTPPALRNYAQSGAETCSPADIDPYSEPTTLLDRLTLLADDGWVEPAGKASTA